MARDCSVILAVTAKENHVPISSCGSAESGCAGADWWLVYSWRYLDNRWHFKRVSICCDNLCVLNLWPFECRLPYRCLTHSPCLLLLFRLPPPSRRASSFALHFASFSLALPFFCHLTVASLPTPRFLAFRFSIDPQSDPEALFRIAPDAGLITTAMELDREREHWHNITVIATQRGQSAIVQYIDPGWSLLPVRWIS